MEKNNRVLITKLFSPKIESGIIARPRLLKIFNEKKNWRAAFITAPAGYGKTVLMIQISKSEEQSLVWYQLDTYDNDPATFLQYLTAGFEQHIPGLDARMTEINKPGVGIRERSTVLINELAQKPIKRFFLVLDDFHLITNPEIHHLVLDLLQYLPNVQFLLSGRNPIPPAFTKFFINQEYLKFKAVDLKFNSQEIAQLMSDNQMGFSSEVAADLEQKTGGWASALHLLSISSTINTGSLTDLNPEELYNYLFTEVFEQLPAEVQKFLTATSVLEDFSAKFCNVFLNQDNSNYFLHYLINHQLFLIPLDGSQKAYRYHQLFRQFLLERLKPEEYLQLLQRAGDSAKQAGDFDQAIEYYLPAGLYEEAIRLIAEAREQIFVEDCWQRASRWLPLIPREILTDPWLALLKAATEYNNGTIIEAEKWVNMAIERFELDKQKNGLARAVSYKALILLSQGRYLESLKLTNSQIVKSSPGSQNIKPYAMLYTAGRFNRALTFLVKKLKDAEQQGDRSTIAQFAMDLSNLYYIKGNYDKALEMYQKIIRLSDNIGLVNYRIQSIPSIYRDRGELDRAFEMAKQSVAIKEECHYLAALPYAYYELANIYVDRGELKLAEEYYRLSIKAMEKGGQYLFLVLSLSYLAQCLSLQGRLVEARSIAEEALAKARGQMSYVLAIGRAVAGPIMVLSGREKDGLRLMEQAIKTFTKIGTKYPLCICHGFIAGILMKENQKISIALKNTRKCLQLAAEGDFIQIFLTHRIQLEPVLRTGLELDIETSFVQKIMLKLGHSALKILLDLAKHHDPQTRQRIIPTLAEIGGSEAEKALKKLTEDENPKVRELALGFVSESIPVDNSEKSHDILQINTFGSFHVSLIGKQKKYVNWSTKKARDLLALLAHQESPLSRERIIAEIWPNSDDNKVIQLFHTTIYHLRQALNKEFIIYQSGEYQLAPGMYTCDRSHFKAIISSIPEILTQKSAHQLEEAILLYQGEYLYELDYDWIIPEREHLKRIYFNARFSLAKFYLETNKSSQAVEHLQFLVANNPLSEEYMSLLMTAYAEIGDRLSLKRCFETLKQELQDELGVDPTLEIRKLYYRLFCLDKKRSG